ncbi:MAG: transporter substrate-binding domain-containing protein, partial [Okeania sp. SIO3C4]|nr:transporter substrate-binding domain-containing protein [Okeania sp. SIO3C4]
MVSFIIATGSIFFANPSVIAQESTFQENTNNSSRILNKIENENILNWGYSNGNFPVSSEDNRLQKPTGLCVDLMVLLESYLKDEGLINNGFKIKPESVRYQNRFDGTRITDPSKPPKFDIECGANTTREDEEGIVFSEHFANSKTKILILKSKKKLFNDVFDGKKWNNVNIGIINNSTSEAKVRTFFANKISIQSFETKKEAIEALKSGEIDGFANDEILLTDILKEGEIPNSQEYVIYKEKLGLEPYGLVLPADDSTWEETINDFIRNNQQKLDKLQKKYIDDYVNDYVNPVSLENLPNNSGQGTVGEEKTPETLDPEEKDNPIDPGDWKIIWQVVSGLLLLGLVLETIYLIKLKQGRQGQKKK